MDLLIMDVQHVFTTISRVVSNERSMREMLKGYRLKEKFEPEEEVDADDNEEDAEPSILTLVTPIFLLLGLLMQLFWEPLIFCNSWNWFLVPLGFKKIAYFHSMGLLLIFHFLALKFQKHNDDYDATSVVNRFIIYVATTSVYFFLAWVAHFWI